MRIRARLGLGSHAAPHAPPASSPRRNSSFTERSWPLKNEKRTISAGRADPEKRYEPWGKLARRGIGVHWGECGCYNRRSCEVFTACFEAVMQILKSHSIGYALWEFRGSFGILDSGRRDIEYEDWHGHRLDRKLLEMLRRY